MVKSTVTRAWRKPRGLIRTQIPRVRHPLVFPRHHPSRTRGGECRASPSARRGAGTMHRDGGRCRRAAGGDRRAAGRTRRTPGHLYAFTLRAGLPSRAGYGHARASLGLGDVRSGRCAEISAQDAVDTLMRIADPKGWASERPSRANFLRARGGYEDTRNSRSRVRRWRPGLRSRSDRRKTRRVVRSSAGRREGGPAGHVVSTRREPIRRTRLTGTMREPGYPKLNAVRADVVHSGNKGPYPLTGRNAPVVYQQARGRRRFQRSARGRAATSGRATRWGRTSAVGTARAGARASMRGGAGTSGATAIGSPSGTIFRGRPLRRGVPSGPRDGTTRRTRGRGTSYGASGSGSGCGGSQTMRLGRMRRGSAHSARPCAPSRSASVGDGAARALSVDLPLRGTRGCLVGMKDRPEVMLCLISTVNDRLVCLRNGLSLSDAALARVTWQSGLGKGCLDRARRSIRIRRCR